jgi:hypothetical protein
MSNTTVLIVLGIVILLLAIWVTFGSKKKKWFKVFLANNDVMLLYRDLNERWWRSNGAYLRFKDEYGHEYTFPMGGGSHTWILMWVSVPDNELNVAREDIKKIHEQLVSKEG